MNEAVDSTINQISSSSFEWWSSFVCCLHIALFHKGFCLVVGGLASWVNSGPPPFSPSRPMGKKLQRDGPRKDNYLWFRMGWPARCVSSTGEVSRRIFQRGTGATVHEPAFNEECVHDMFSGLARTCGVGCCSLAVIHRLFT